MDQQKIQGLTHVDSSFAGVVRQHETLESARCIGRNGPTARAEIDYHPGSFL